MELILDDLQEKHKQWLYNAIIKMVMADQRIEESEVESLRRAFQAKKEDWEPEKMKPLIQVTANSIKLKPFDNLDYEQAFVILTEIIQTAAVDGEFPQQEKALLKDVCLLLGFDEEAQIEIMDWVEYLTLANHKHLTLKKSLKKKHLSNRPKPS